MPARLLGMLGVLIAGFLLVAEANGRSSTGDGTLPPSRERGQRSARPPIWPAGAAVMPFEDLEGAILVQARLSVAPERSAGSLSGRVAGAEPAVTDTSGWFVLDSGAGYLVLDRGLAGSMGLTTVAGPGAGTGLAVAERPLALFELGGYQARGLQPLLLFDAGVVRRALDRPILGLIGRQPLGGTSLLLDYGRDSLALLPADTPPPEAPYADFEVVGDGKIVLKASVAGGPPADFILDTGATKCVLFARALPRVAPGHARWRSLDGLTAPTVAGDEPMRLLRVPSLRVGARGGAVRDVDCAVVSGGLEDLLAQVTGREIAGLVGYSYLKRFRVTLDYSRGRAYLEPRPGYREPRPFEFTQVGLQLARGGRGIEVVAVAEGSPAQQAGIAPGARVLQVDSLDAARHDLLTLARALEGPARSTVTITILDGGGTRVVTLRRRRLL